MKWSVIKIGRISSPVRFKLATLWFCNLKLEGLTTGPFRSFSICCLLKLHRMVCNADPDQSNSDVTWNDEWFGVSRFCHRYTVFQLMNWQGRQYDGWRTDEMMMKLASSRLVNGHILPWIGAHDFWIMTIYALAKTTSKQSIHVHPNTCGYYGIFDWAIMST